MTDSFAPRHTPNKPSHKTLDLYTELGMSSQRGHGPLLGQPGWLSTRGRGDVGWMSPNDEKQHSTVTHSSVDKSQAEKPNLREDMLRDSIHSCKKQANPPLMRSVGHTGHGTRRGLRGDYQRAGLLGASEGGMWQWGGCCQHHTSRLGGHDEHVGFLMTLNNMGPTARVCLDTEFL